MYSLFSFGSPLTHSPTHPLAPTLFNPTDVPKPSHPPPPSPQPHRMLCTVMPWTATEPIPSIIVPPTHPAAYVTLLELTHYCTHAP